MGKVDHFVDLINRPYFYQDVSYGNKVLTLDNGDRIEMPNVVKILTRSTMIEQNLEYCKEQCHEPLSRSTLFKILEVREASQRKSLQGLDNTAADGAAGFQTIETLVETLEKGGMEKQWCLRIFQNLRDAKRTQKPQLIKRMRNLWESPGSMGYFQISSVLPLLLGQSKTTTFAPRLGEIR